MTELILVTGGTGTLGRHVVQRLRQAGRDVRILSRHPHAAGDGTAYVTGDLLAGQGIEAAVDGAAVIVHCAGARTGDDVATRNLVRAAARAGTPRLVYISVVGADRVAAAGRLDRAMFGYFATKLAAEREVAGSGLPWTTLRAAQFYDAILLVTRQLPGCRRARSRPGSGSSRSTPARWRPASRSWPSARPPAWSPTWPARAPTAWTSCSAATCAPAASTACSCRCTSPARPPAPSGPARTSPPITRRATGPGKTSCPNA
jgi:NAD(P)H-binding